MKLKYPGLLQERLPSGQIRYRVRVEGNPKRRIRLHVSPDHKHFSEAYHAARAGVEIPPDQDPAETAIKGSLAWLIHRYLADLEDQVKANLKSIKTLKTRRNILSRLIPEYGAYDLNMPASQVLKIRDSLRHTPATADQMTKALRSMYEFASSLDSRVINPAAGVAKIDRGKGGTIAWTVEDLYQFRTRHPAGTNAHLYLTLLMFTGCRIGDAVRLGRRNEVTQGGVRALQWQPVKANSTDVIIPMLDPLYTATRKTDVIGPTYMLTDFGRPYRTEDALGQRMRKWCDQAGLHHLSSHGVRKGAGSLLAHLGCTQYEIMAILGHSDPKTSAIYTKQAERWHLAVSGMDRLRNMEW